MFGFRWVAPVASLALFGLAGCSDDDAEQANPQAISDESAFPPPEATTRANIQRAFARIENDDYAGHVRESFAEGSTFVINGPSSVAGTYTGKDRIIAGFDRLFSVVPVHHFTLNSIQVTNTAEQVNARVIWRDMAQIDEEQSLPAQGVNSIEIGPEGVTREEMTISLDDPNALP